MDRSPEETLQWVTGLVEVIVNNQGNPDAQWLSHIHELQGYFQSEIQQGHEIRDITLDYQNGYHIIYTQELHHRFIEATIATNSQSLKQFWTQEYQKTSHESFLSRIEIADKIVDLLDDLEFEHQTFKLNNPFGTDMMHTTACLYLMERTRLSNLEPALLTIKDVDKFDDLGAFMHRSFAMRLGWDIMDHLEVIDALMPVAIANAMARNVDRYHEGQFKIGMAKDKPVYQRVRQSENKARKTHLRALFQRAQRDFATEDKTHYGELLEDVVHVVRPKLRVRSLI